VVSSDGGHLELVPGAELDLDGSRWKVLEVLAGSGEVVLSGAGGEVRTWPLGRLLVGRVRAHADRTPGVAQSASLEDLDDDRLERLRLRVAHALEADCGFRSGDPACPESGEPRPQYDPAITTKQQRLRRKETELAALHAREARRLGLDQMSARTLRRLADDWWEGGRRLESCIDGRWLRLSPGRPSVSEQITEAIEAVQQECLHRSRVTMRTRETLIHQYVREKFGEEVEIPHYSTLRRVWLEWFGPGGTRPRYQRSAAAMDPGGSSVVVTRPGQVVALDTTPLPVLLRAHAFGDAASAHLTLAMDVFSRSLVAFRLTLGSDTTVDVGLLLRDVMMPLPMRPGWGEERGWPYPGVPAALVAEFAGYEVAGLPFFAPDTVTTDHGSVYKSHHLVEVEQRLGCSILPARTMRATDKAACERAFRSAQTLLLESLPGFRGVDVADRGADPEGDAVFTVSAMEHLVATWIVAVWQNRRLGEHAPPWAPDERHSPNTLFAASFAQGGFGLRIPSPDLYYGVLPASYVRIHRKRGVKIKNLWYDGPGLDDHRGRRSPRGGKHPGQWRIRRDPRDRRETFFEDPLTGQWHALRWTGLPPEGQVPAFSDAKVDELMAEAARRGLVPRDDRDLLPVLLDLLKEHVPVEQWPGRRAKRPRASGSGPGRPARSNARRSRPGTGTGPGKRLSPPYRRRSCRCGETRSARRSTPTAGAAGNGPFPRPRGRRARSAPTTASGTRSCCRPTKTKRTPMTDRSASQAGIAPFLRAGPPPDRTTFEGWQQWLRVRGTFVPAPRMTEDQYTSLSARKRALYDLHRTATHVNLVLQRTPMSDKVSALMNTRLRNNALDFEPGTRDGLMISGGGFQGKTATACDVAAEFEGVWRELHQQLLPPPVPGTRDVLAPVVYCKTPVRATPKGLCQAVLDFFGEPQPKALHLLIRSVRDALKHTVRRR
jgi:hypothetical protein